MDAIIVKESIDIAGVAIYALISLVLLMLSAMASGSEVAFFSLTRSDLEELEESSDIASGRVLDLLSNPDRLLATILVTNNMVNICLVITVTQLVGEIFSFSGVWEFVFNTVIITFLLLLFGEIMPKVISQSKPVKFSRLISLPLKFLRWFVYPLAFILMRTSSKVSRLATRNAEISIEELADAVDIAETGSIEEQKMLSGIVNFGQTEVVEIMHSRVDITGLEYDTAYDEVRRLIVETGYSRIPVYGEDLDDVRGMLYVKDLLPYISEGEARCSRGMRLLPGEAHARQPHHKNQLREFRCLRLKQLPAAWHCRHKHTVLPQQHKEVHPRTQAQGTLRVQQ